MASRTPTKTRAKSQSSTMRWLHITNSRATLAVPAPILLEQCKVGPDAMDFTRPPPRTGNKKKIHDCWRFITNINLSLENIRFSGLVGSLGKVVLLSFRVVIYLINVYISSSQSGVGLSGGGLVGGGKLT